MKADEILALWEIPLSDSLDGASEKEKHKGSAFEEQGTQRLNQYSSKPVKFCIITSLTKPSGVN